jgi:hypothetical protein
VISRGFRYKPEPTVEQDALFRQFAGVCRLVYNFALEQRQTWGRKHRISYTARCADLTRLRAEFAWVATLSPPGGALCTTRGDHEKRDGQMARGSACGLREHPCCRSAQSGP